MQTHTLYADIVTAHSSRPPSSPSSPSSTQSATGFISHSEIADAAQPRLAGRPLQLHLSYPPCNTHVRGAESFVANAHIVSEEPETLGLTGAAAAVMHLVSLTQLTYQRKWSSLKLCRERRVSRQILRLWRPATLRGGVCPP